MFLQQFFGINNFVTHYGGRQHIQRPVSVSVCGTLDPARADLSQLFPREHGAHALTHVLQPTARTTYERCGDVESRCKAVAPECWKGARIKIRVAIIEGQYHG